MSEQKLFWVSKKSTYGCGKDALGYGAEVGDKIPEDMIPHFKKTGEIGALEMAKPENVEVDKAYQSVKDKLDLYETAIEDVVKLLEQDSIKKDEKMAMIEQLEGLSDE